MNHLLKFHTISHQLFLLERQRGCDWVEFWLGLTCAPSHKILRDKNMLWTFGSGWDSGRVWNFWGNVRAREKAALRNMVCAFQWIPQRIGGREGRVCVLNSIPNFQILTKPGVSKLWPVCWLPVFVSKVLGAQLCHSLYSGWLLLPLNGGAA